MSKTPKKSRTLRVHKETILKILIAVGIIAIIVSAYIQYGIPYLHERQLEKLDARRVSDLTTLNTEIVNILKTNSQANLGFPDTVYISVPSTQSDCGDLDLPTLAPNWSYHCVATSTLQNADGTGWLPIDFSKFSSTTVSTISVDPVNNVSNYFAAVLENSISNQGNFALSAEFSSKKHINANDKNPLYYILGNVNLWNSSLGLIGYWPMNENSGNILNDYSGNGNDGTILGNTNWNPSNHSIYFNGNNYAIFGSNNLTNTIGSSGSNYSIELWVKDLNPIDQSLTEKWSSSNAYPWAIRIQSGQLIFSIYDGENYIYTSTDASILNNKEWNQIVAVKDSTKNLIELYVNGTLESEFSTPVQINTINAGGYTVGARDIRGEFKADSYISEFSLYNNDLNAAEIRLLFLTEGIKLNNSRN